MKTTDKAQLEAWLARCALADRSAFEQLYSATSAHLFAVVLRMVRNRDTAEEVLQEAYVQIWNRAADYRPQRAQAMTWMTSIARYRALDRIRRQERDAGTEVLEEDQFETGLEGPLKALSNGQFGDALRRCIDVISLDQRTSILLAFYHGLSHEQISRHIDQPLGTVKSWIRRGLERLRGCLET